MQQAIEIHPQVTGQRPTGWYTERNSPHTRKLVIPILHISATDKASNL
jgi:hypothetical protein